MPRRKLRSSKGAFGGLDGEPVQAPVQPEARNAPNSEPQTDHNPHDNILFPEQRTRAVHIIYDTVQEAPQARNYARVNSPTTTQSGSQVRYATASLHRGIINENTFPQSQPRPQGSRSIRNHSVISRKSSIISTPIYFDLGASFEFIKMFVLGALLAMGRELTRRLLAEGSQKEDEF